MSVKFERETVQNAPPSGDRQKASFMQQMTKQTSTKNVTEGKTDGKTDGKAKPGYLAVRNQTASAIWLRQY